MTRKGEMDERELFHLPDLNAVLVRNPPATFAVYAAGDSRQAPNG